VEEDKREDDELKTGSLSPEKKEEANPAKSFMCLTSPII